MNTFHFINTSLQRGARLAHNMINRFIGFPSGMKTVETVFGDHRFAVSPLKRGVNQILPAGCYEKF
jgi:hypothetical protein